MPHWRETRILTRGARRLVDAGGRKLEYLPAAQDPDDDVFNQLEFALRKEGLHLELLRKVRHLVENAISKLKQWRNDDHPMAPKASPPKDFYAPEIAFSRPRSWESAAKNTDPTFFVGKYNLTIPRHMVC